VARINPTEIDGAKRQTVSSLRTLQAATDQQKQQIDESVFRAWVEPKIPLRDPGGLLMKKADRDASGQFGLEFLRYASGEGPRVRRLAAGGKEIRTVGPAVKEKPVPTRHMATIRANLQDGRSRR
jgi:hypothetical protein